MKEIYYDAFDRKMAKSKPDIRLLRAFCRFRPRLSSRKWKRLFRELEDLLDQAAALRNRGNISA